MAKKFKIVQTGRILIYKDGLYRDEELKQAYDANLLNQLGLVLEEIKPEVRKLYAYKEENTAIVFFATFPDSRSTHAKYQRYPEFDISYPPDGETK